MSLTEKQKQVYDFIIKHQMELGVPPTQREIKEHFGLKSFGSVQRYLQYLEDDGLLEKDWNARRGIKVLGTPKVESLPGFVRIPLLGKIAAGAPVLAEENWEDTLVLPEIMIGPAGDFFALRVRGDSMIDAGINTGDIAIIRSQADAPQGAIVAALIESEATLKRFFRNKKGIELRPENSRLSPIILTEGAEQVAILGVLQALWRWYS